ncbi:MAG: hypothetical protein RSC43_01890 [Clostridia bacterium]
MKRKRITSKKNTGINISASLAILAAILLCGIVAGCITASYIGDEAGAALRSYVLNYTKTLGVIPSVGELFPGAIWNVYKYPLCTFLFGFTVLGIVLIPGAVALRGFFLSFSVATMIRLYGSSGLTLALAMFGVSSLIGIPCLLIISAQGFHAARSFARVMAGGKRVIIGSVFPRGYFVIFGVCMAALFAAVLLEVFLTPKLVALVAVSVLK